MKFGAPVWPFKWEAPYEETILRISELGFDAVELIAWDRDVLNDYYTDEKVEEIREILNSEKLELSQLVSTPEKMASPDEEERRESIEHFRDLVEVGVETGAAYVNSVSPHPFDLDFPDIKDKPLVQEQKMDIPSGLDWEKNWDDYIEALRECASICEDYGIKYTIEPHPYRYVRNSASMLRILDQVDSDAIGMNFDPSHLYPSGELPQMAVYELGENILHAHLSDNDAQTNAHWRPGKGKIDWKAVLTALKDVGFDGVLSIELEDVPGVSRSGRFGEESKSSTEELDEEYKKSKEYLANMAEDVGVELD